MPAGPDDQWYEVLQDAHSDSRGRRAAVLACANMTSHGKGAIIIVDEADNLLNTRHAWFDRGETHDKGWLNRFLDEPGHRIVWVTNRTEAMEPSVARRFSFSLAFNPFTRKQRELAWKSVLRTRKAARRLSADRIAALAGSYDLSVGIMDMAVAKAVDVCTNNGEAFEQALRLHLDAHIELLSGGKTPRRENPVEEAYSTEGLNIRGNLPSMMTTLDAFDRYLRNPDKPRRLNMNLLFYGPPGTGKSELARHIADRLDRQLMVKRASDILNPYVGMTEAAIAGAFAEAEREDAVLVIDEADSLLFSRSSARRSWEISFTNEFLTQMERFQGILVCTTNRLDGLDPASIRRFNHKIGFDFLTSQGNVLFYSRILAPLVDGSIEVKVRKRLERLSPLAPGDFKTVRDRFFFEASANLSHERLVNALMEEAAFKAPQKGVRCIGFGR